MGANGVQMAILMAALPNLQNLKEITITDCCGRLTLPGRPGVTRGRIYQTLYHRKNQWESHWSFTHSIFGMAAEDFRHMSNVFANLRTLKLTIDDELVQSWQEENLANGRMARVLRTAPRLECLEMSFIGIDDDDKPLEKWSSGRDLRSP